MATSTSATSSGTVVFDPNATTSQTITTPDGTYTITPVDDEGPAAPDYTKGIAYGAAVSADARTALNAQLAQTQAIIKSKPTDFEAWVNLGVLRKIGGDYQGAAEAWRYVAAIYPNSTVPLDNLAGLYMDFIKNYPKAEANLKASISLDAHDIHAYEMLVELYTTYGYKSKADALVLIRQGLVQNPNNATLTQLKAQLSQ
jgi:tetratricopeptide (TPR) repeat protein